MKNDIQNPIAFTLMQDGTYAASLNRGDERNLSLTEIVIPAEHNGKPVSQVENDAFEGLTSLKEVIISEGVSRIGRYAFYNCTSLECVIVPTSVVSIDVGAFSGCTSLVLNEYDNANYLEIAGNPYYALIKAKSNDIESCLIHDDTVLIACSAFQNCWKIKSLRIPSKLERIGHYAFWRCSGLSEVIFADDGALSSIGFESFKECYNIKSISFPKSLRYIDSYAFSYCGGLENITFSDDTSHLYISNGAFADSNNVRYNVYGGAKYLPGENNPYFALIAADDGKQAFIDINSKARFIAGDAFYFNCENVKSITIPASVEFIGAHAFYNCDALKNAKFEDPVGWSSDGYAFSPDELTDPEAVVKYLTETYAHKSFSKN